MAFAKISQVAHYAPAQVVTNDDLSKIMDTSDEWIRSRTGIQERRISLNENTSDLATNVAYQLLEKSGLSPEELDFVLVATISPDNSMPSVAARVQGTIGAVNAFAFDITAACSGFVFALATAEKIDKVRSLQKKVQLLVLKFFQKLQTGLIVQQQFFFGDGAGGVLLEESEEEHFFGESLNTDGSKGGLESGASAVISPYSDGTEQPNPYMQMDGKAIFDFAVKTVSKSIKALVEEKGEPDYFLLHQANIRILDTMAKKIDVSRDKFLANMMSYGNTSAASIPILLSENVANETLKLGSDQTILLSGFGGGLTWGSLIVKIQLYKLCTSIDYKKYIYLKGENKMAVFEKVQEIIVEELGKDAEEVKVETTFDELDADSLDVFQVISEIEDEFDIQIETEEGLNTVGDLVAYVEEKTK